VGSADAVHGVECHSGNSDKYLVICTLPVSLGRMQMI
jgi:hypothetical protein